MPCLQTLRFYRKSKNVIAVNRIILLVQVGRSCNIVLQINQLVLDLHYIRSINRSLQLLVLSFVCLCKSLVSGTLIRIVVSKLLCERFTVLSQVTSVVEGKLVHLHTTLVIYLNFEVCIRYSTTFREVNIALEHVGSLQNVCTDILFVVDQNPTFSVLCCLFVTCKVCTPNLPILPVTLFVCISIITCYQTVVCGLDRFVLLSISINTLEDNESFLRSTGTPFGAFGTV